MNHPIDFEGIAPDIKQTMYDYVAIGSFTDTVHEREVEPFLEQLLASFPYFQKHPDHCGVYRIPDDHLGRGVVYAMVRGSGADTVCFVHHYDVVGVEDFKTLKDVALLPDELHAALEQNPEMLSEEARSDLESGEFLFCKGGCDMKAGGAIQLTLLNEYGKLALEGRFGGNVVLIAVPDEENLSAGMRGAATKLAELKRTHGLQYRLMINSEPHQRREKAIGVFSLGTVGKLMPFVYVRGSMSHVGKVFEGLNPVMILSEIERRTELNMDFTDTVDTDETSAECSMPPSWIYMKDSKEVYDVSMPLNAYGCISILNLTSGPGEVLKRLRGICEEAFEDVIRRANDAYHTFLRRSKRTVTDLPWQPRVSSFAELLEQAVRAHGESFEALYEAKRKELLSDFRAAKRSIISCNYELVSFVFDHLDDVSPRVVCGLVPPYYPCVSNLEYEKTDETIRELYPFLRDYAKSTFDQDYVKEYFFSGICDLSYIDMQEPEAVRKSLEDSMPLFGAFYDIPLADIHAISMPGINIGPWGKDFHKLSERVLTEDVCNRTPRILDAAVKYMLHN